MNFRVKLVLELLRHIPLGATKLTLARQVHELGPIDIVARSAPAVGVAVDFVDLDLNTVKEVVVECEVATVNHLVLVELDTVAMVAISTSV